MKVSFTYSSHALGPFVQVRWVSFIERLMPGEVSIIRN